MDNLMWDVGCNLMWDVILGREFLREHKSVTFEFGGPKCPLNLNALDVLKGVTPVRLLFEDLTPDCKPVVCKSRNYSPSDRAFIVTQCSDKSQKCNNLHILSFIIKLVLQKLRMIKGETVPKRKCDATRRNRQADLRTPTQGNTSDRRVIYTSASPVIHPISCHCSMAIYGRLTIGS